MKRLPLLLLCLLPWMFPAGAIAQAASSDVETRSFYIPMEDGVRLAADVHLPSQRDEGETYPALLTLTRYWRASEDPQTGDPRPAAGALERHFIENDYAIVSVDVRGSGASFGTRPVEYGPQEVRDGHAIVDWVVSQDWCSGVVGAYGTSYTGTTAELLTACGHPAIKAVIPGWSDFEAYRSPVRPYGLVPTFLGTWSQMVGWMDENATGPMRGSVRRVDGDEDGSLLKAALLEHRQNPEVMATVRGAEFRDDALASGITYEEISPLHWMKEIQESDVPMLVLVSWLDAGTAEGTLWRFLHFSNPQKVVIMASSHGGRFDASPYAVADRPMPPRPSVQEQFKMRTDFFDHHLKGLDRGVDEWPPIRYFNLGEDVYRESDQWPLEGTAMKKYFLAENNGLSQMAPTASSGEDVYKVDFSVRTGRLNRWMTQMGTPITGLHDRASMDARMLTYTTEPLDADLQIAGTPVITLAVRSDHEDGAFLVYLEDVDPDGKSRYLTEGGLRAIHRRLGENPYFSSEKPYHSFNREDQLPLVPGEVAELVIPLWPITARLKEGHRLRVAIAGADADSFERVPESGTPTLAVQRHEQSPSFLDLPVAPLD